MGIPASPFAAILPLPLWFRYVLNFITHLFKLTGSTASLSQFFLSQPSLPGQHLWKTQWCSSWGGSDLQREEQHHPTNQRLEDWCHTWRPDASALWDVQTRSILDPTIFDSDLRPIIQTIASLTISYHGNVFSPVAFLFYHCLLHSFFTLRMAVMASYSPHGSYWYFK